MRGRRRAGWHCLHRGFAASACGSSCGGRSSCRRRLVALHSLRLLQTNRSALSRSFVGILRLCRVVLACARRSYLFSFDLMHFCSQDVKTNGEQATEFNAAGMAPGLALGVQVSKLHGCSKTYIFPTIWHMLACRSETAEDSSVVREKHRVMDSLWHTYRVCYNKCCFVYVRTAKKG